MLALSERQTGSDIFEAQWCRTDLLTFWDRGKLNFHGELHTQRLITSDHTPDFSLLSFQCPWNLWLSVRQVGRSWPVSWGLTPKHALLKSCLFVCIKETPSSELSLALAFTCLSCWPSSKQALKFWSTLLPTDLLTFWDPREIAFAGSLAYPKTGRFRLHGWVFFVVFPQPPEICDFYQFSGACWPISWGLRPKTALLKSCLFATAVPILLTFASVWSTVRPTDLLTSWDPGKSHLHAALHIQRPITSDHMPDLFLLSF